jgi:LPXTG-site transpeptidase (sortase) family protein
MKKTDKILIKYFVFIFLVSALIINWQEISWLFNYKVVSQFFSNFFQGIFSKETDQKLSENEVNKEKIIKESEISEKENSLEIPKLEIFAPLILVDKENEVQKGLDRGVVLFPNSVLPGRPGQTIILGHSAPAGWPKIKYDWVFSRLNELSDGDEIFVYFENKKYTYQFSKKIFLERGEELPSLLTNSENILVLISCWPPGKDLRRIAVVAK